MISIILNCCRRLQLDIVKIEGDIFETRDRRVWLINPSFSRLVELQKIYGTGRIHHLPHPVLSLVSLRNNDFPPEKFAIISDEPVSHPLIKDYITISEAEYINSQPDFGLYILYRPKIIELNYLLYTSNRPFLVISDVQLDIIPEILRLKTCQMSILPVKIEEILQNWLVISSRIQRNLLAISTIFSWINRVEFLSSNLDEVVSYHKGIYFPIVPKYRNFSILMKRICTPGGVHFVVDTIDFFLTGPKVYFHPWIGVIDTLNVEILHRLISRSNFHISAQYCLGLICFNTRLADDLIELLASVDLKIVVLRIPAPMKIAKTFSLEKWNLTQGLVKYLSDGSPRTISLNGLNPEEKDCIVVISDLDTEILGQSYNLLSQGRLIVSKPEGLPLQFLGPDYPLFTEHLEPYKLKNFVTPQRVEASMHHLSQLRFISPEDFLNRILTSKIGHRLRKNKW